MMVERAPSIDSESTSSTISTSAMRAILEKLKWDRHRSSTQQQYYCVWKMFNEFFIKLDDKPNEWTDQLNLFVAYLANTGKKSTTIKSYASAIKAILYQGGVVISEDRSTINSVTRACRLHTDKYKIRLPITKSLLRRIWMKLRMPSNHVITWLLYMVHFSLLRTSDFSGWGKLQKLVMWYQQQMFRSVLTRRNYVL